MTYPEPRIGTGAQESFGHATVAHPVSSALPLDLSAPAQARHLVLDALKGSPLVDLTESAMLVVSELVTNALRHTTGRLNLDVWCGSTFVQLGVGDDAPGDPVTQPASALRAGGRGMPLIDAIVSTRSIARDVGGKTIWCQLDIDGPAGNAWGPVL